MNPQQSNSNAPEGFVYRVLGPDGSSYRWIARTVHGHVAHGKTEEAAIANLKDGLKALAETIGEPYAAWKDATPGDRCRVLTASELVQA